MNTINEDTICAIISPPGIGAINVIRISGNNAITICDELFIGRKKLGEIDHNTILYGKIKTEKEIIDNVLVSVFLSPHSYTGENTVEISCHGNPLISKKIINELINNKIRIAEPGEFTKRAFLNNKLDLLQAEAVAEVINSRSEIALKGSRLQLDGFLTQKINSIKENLISFIGLLELELDFAEEDIELVSKTTMVENIGGVISDLDTLISSFNVGRIIFEGINVAILGKPNVGKSSLLNRLLKEDRAIVSNIPGTTRDVIKEELYIDGVCFRLHDTAGIRKSKNVIEKKGIERAKDAIKNSDIIILLLDKKDLETKTTEKYLKLNKKFVIRVLNKIDLINKDYISKIPSKYIKVSIKKDIGIEKIIKQLKHFAEKQGVYSENTSIINNERQLYCLKDAKEKLQDALNSLENKMSNEFVVVDLRAALYSLKELVGEITTEDILNSIFSKFCIGK